MSKILVSNKGFNDAYEAIRAAKFIACDTETTGFHSYLGDKLFSIIISTKENDYYFNFNDEADHLGNKVPSEYTILMNCVAGFFSEILNDTTKTVFYQNAKFDLHMLAKEGIRVKGSRVFCTQALSRLVHNQLHSYSLANLGELIGHAKDDSVMKYIMKNKLYTLVDVGKKEPRKDLHFNLVPFDIISNYGMQDGRVTYELGMYIINRFVDLNADQISRRLTPLTAVVENELELTKTLFDMERVGVKIDVDYCKRAYEYEKEGYLEAMAKFHALTGIEFEDAAKCFKQAFEALGLKGGITAKGNPSYSADNLPDNAISTLILKYRGHYKRATTYFKNYLDLVDKDGAIHCNFNQGGTVTGRMSSRDPNLQNVPKHGEDESAFPIRKAFIPREGFFFAMIDYSQQEYRLLMDIIQETEIIHMITEEGLDVHTATSKLANVKRLVAKNINFLSIYGGGAGKLQEYTKGTLQEAKTMMKNYFSKIRKVKPFMRAISDISSRRGYIVNPYGRRLLHHQERPYVMTNHFIQGGGADMIKLAMNRMHKYLEDKKSRMVLTVHDECVFEIADDEAYILPELGKIMVGAYEHNSLPMEVDTEISRKNWFDKEAHNAKT